jgi:MFS family permease
MTGLGFDARAVSSAIAISASVTLPVPLVLGWLSDRIGRKRCLFVCYAFSALGLLLLIPALSLWQFWLATSLLAIAEKSNGVTQAYAADLTPAQAIGRGMSLFNSTSLFAGILGLSSAGFLMQTIGIDPTLLLVACLPLIALSLLLRLRPPAPMPKALPIAQAQT